MRASLVSGGRYDRRGKSRIEMKAPVYIGRSAIGYAEGVDAATGRSQNISMGGAFITTEAAGPFAEGDLLKISIEIPAEDRKHFPFSLISGSCRVVRAEKLKAEGSVNQWGLGLELCRQDATMLGAIVTT